MLAFLLAITIIQPKPNYIIALIISVCLNFIARVLSYTKNRGAGRVFPYIGRAIDTISPGMLFFVPYLLVFIITWILFGLNYWYVVLIYILSEIICEIIFSPIEALYAKKFSTKTHVYTTSSEKHFYDACSYYWNKIGLSFMDMFQLTQEDLSFENWKDTAVIYASQINRGNELLDNINVWLSSHEVTN